jgi:hypothetical protein
VPIKNPPHPGDFVRTEIIEAAGLTVTAAAEALRVSRPALPGPAGGRSRSRYGVSSCPPRGGKLVGRSAPDSQ